ncbi:putative glycine cleavage system H protein [Elsinoe australis]|uniref:Glycine cleavage system H protein n=1 Tax=Elsinoe australis TaxID=40998 RepID=A0A4U7B9V6_9PEZI|nr:putative glycine cleavage system H protein [Elsinoe australis]
MAAAVALRSALKRSLQSQVIRPATAPKIATRCSRIATPVGWRGFSSSPASYVKKYTEDHEWVELSEDGSSATIGISTYAASALGDVVYVELPAVDLEFSSGDSIGAVESVKSASDIMAPVAGTIIESNSALEEKPGHINKSPEDEAWLAKIKVSDPSEVEALMDADAYKAFTEEAGKS